MPWMGASGSLTVTPRHRRGRPMRTRHVVAATATLALVGTTAGAVLAGAVRAAPTTRPSRRSRAQNLVSPLSVARRRRRHRLLDPELRRPALQAGPAEPKTVYASKSGNEVGGVSVRRRAVLARDRPATPDKPGKVVVTLDRRPARSARLADICAYEKQTNPDGKITYGVRGISASRCRAGRPRRSARRPTRASRSRTPTPRARPTTASTYVADAGANAVLAISPRGAVSHGRRHSGRCKVTITDGARPSAMRAARRASVGKTYRRVGARPTSSVGRDGKLYVTTCARRARRRSSPLGAVLPDRPDRAARSKTVVGGLFSPDRHRGRAATATCTSRSCSGGEISQIKARHVEGPDLRRGAGSRPPSSATPTRAATPPIDAAADGRKPKGQVVTVTQLTDR